MREEERDSDDGASVAIGRAPLVTLYIANHNYERYLRQSIESVLAQTLQDFELIIIDDGSTDHSHLIVEEFASDPRVTPILQPNRGLAATCNLALRLARGKYIVRLDADDYLDQHALELMASALDRQGELALVYPDYYLVDEGGTILQQVRRNTLEELSLLDHPAHGACTMFRKSILDEVGGYDESFTCQDGVDIWLKIIARHKVSNINLPLFHHRRHSSNLTHDEERLLSTQAEIFKREVAARDKAHINVLAIIPVRGSGLDPRSSPLRSLGNKRLIDWTLEAALESSELGDVLVTTPDEDVLEHVRSTYGDRVIGYRRGETLARINTRLDATLLDGLDRYGRTEQEPDAIMALFVEAPFRSGTYIDKAIHTMQLYDVEVIDGVRLLDEMLYLNSGYGLRLFQANPELRLEREAVYQRAGGLQLIRRESLRRTRNWMTECTISHVILDQRAAFTIRSEMDWKIAGFFARQGN